MKQCTANVTGCSVPLSVPVALCLFVSAVMPGLLQANDTGVLDFFLNIDAVLPDRSEAISPERAVSAVTAHIQEIRAMTSTAPAMEAYWRDYKAILDKWHEPSTAKPVIITDENGKSLVARYLVGLRMNGAVGGFWAVGARNGEIQAELMWTDELKPLWLLPASIWEKAASVNELPSLEELVPPYAQFTTGIPVDPRSPSVHIVDGIVGELPMKTQEERRERVEWFNAIYGTRLKVTLAAHEGRRTASSKCMSVAASYIADWWTARSGRKLPSYVAGAGGQKEYGFNPRLLECLYYSRRRKGPISKYIGNFKVAPFSKDRVTGEPIPYSPRGYARILVETGAGRVPDNLVPTLLQYETTDNPFCMDEKPLCMQIFTTGYFPAKAIRQDLAGVKDPDFPFHLAENYGESLSVTDIRKALDTWGPLLGQHMGRNKDGTPKIGRFGMGVHSVMIVGTTTIDGKDMLVYRETFGQASHEYLEDSFLGPSFRAMPIEYFYQAIAFPHRLYLQVRESATGEDGGLACLVEVRTNRGRDLVDADSLSVSAGGKTIDSARFKPVSRGLYRLWIPAGELADEDRIEIMASKRYFADEKGDANFILELIRQDGTWTGARQ